MQTVFLGAVFKVDDEVVRVGLIIHVFFNLDILQVDAVLRVLRDPVGTEVLSFQDEEEWSPPLPGRRLLLVP